MGLSFLPHISRPSPCQRRAVERAEEWGRGGRSAPQRQPEFQDLLPSLACSVGK